MPRLVVIDDSPTICAIVRTLLCREGWEVETYLNPLTAMKDLWNPDVPAPTVVLLDIELPQMDGYKVAQAIRKNGPESLRGVPLIGFSHRDGLLDRVKARLAGMNDYLTKPFQGQDLLRLVKGFVG